MAFAGGYTSALVALDPSLGEEPGAFCATEDEGGHPRGIKTRLEQGRLTGTKRFISLGPWAKTLVVVASEGTSHDGRNRLRVLRVPAASVGVHLEPGPLLPFIPEVAHASVVFEGVEVQPSNVLAGDGYEAYVKPFRTIEDLHVHAAILGYLLRVATLTGWPSELHEGLLAALVAAHGLGSMDATSPATHLALAGWLAVGERILADAAPHWSAVEATERERFERDRPLLDVATKARQGRRRRAWELIASQRVG
jgi:hypothetical protein